MSEARFRWGKLLSKKRIRDLFKTPDISSSGPETFDQSVDDDDYKDHRTEFEKDYDRAIFSTPVRRLHDKAQVFPLEKHDFVRTRLTHSLEVASVAKGIAKGITKIEDLIPPEYASDIQTIAATCGLIHDLGNPPFGHAGEQAIQGWFKDNRDVLAGLSEQKKKDFLKFEGNAHTLRLLSKLQVLVDFHGLNLTCGTLSAAIKYVAASDQTDENQHVSSKPGFFWSERELIEKVGFETGTKGKRNPIAFMFEAADDVVYSIADIEDAVKKGILTWRRLRELFEAKDIKGKRLLKLMDEAEKYLKRNNKAEIALTDVARVQMFRVKVIGFSVKSIVKAFRNKYEDIMTGNYYGELYKDSDAKDVIDTCSSIGRENIYCHSEVLESEILGKKVIQDLLTLFWTAIKGMSEKEIGKENPKTKSFEGKLFALLSRNYKNVFRKNYKDDEANDRYYRLQLLTDYICGMTDSFACDLHRRLRNS